MKILPNKLIIWITIIILVIGVGVVFVFVDDVSIKNFEKDKSVTFVSGTDGKMWYIKARGCSDEVYENTDSKNIFDTMCRAHRTDGEFVYYDGVRNISPNPIMELVITGEKIASSSMPSKIQKQGSIIIEGADPETFEIISSDYLAADLKPEQNPTLVYSRDKNFLYREGIRVEDVDPNSFLILGRGYIKNENSVYLRGEKLEGSEPKTFEFLKWGYARDKNFVYIAWSGGKIEGSDGASFEIVDRDYAKDKNFLYYKQKKLAKADPSTFELVYHVYTADGLTSTTPSGYAKDKNFLYYKGEYVEGADPGTFEIVGFSGVQAKDKNFVYAPNAEKLLWIDAGTFEVVPDGYFKDKNAVYFGEGKIITGADPETFEVLGIYIKDKDSVWKSNNNGRGGNIRSVSLMDGADPETFEFLKNGYARDKNFVYISGDILQGADSASVEIFDNGYLKDKSFVYLNKDKLQGVDPATFEVINYNYTKDKNNVWFALYNHGGLTSLRKVEGADVSTFEIIDHRYTKDKDTVYYRGVALVGVKPNSFEFFSCGYIKDDSRVFFLERDEVLNTIDSADAASFEVVDRTCYAKDNNSVYFINASQRGRSDFVKIDGADPKTFEFIIGMYTKDLSTIYYKGVRIENADPKTFKVVGPRAEYAKDENFVYYKGLQIAGADQKSFESIKGAYWKDTSSVYYDGLQIEGADVETFEVNDFETVARDKNTLYKNGKPVTEKAFINKDSILPPGIEGDIVMPPFGLGDVQILEMYPIGL